MLRRMIDWLSSLKELLSQYQQAVLVTVIAVDGSVPREIGATLVVSANNQTGTIGGGNLEHSAITHAREMLESASKPAADRGVIECQQISLGPNLGQCCGGRVELLYERVALDSSWLSALLQATDLTGLCLYRCLDDSTAFISAPAKASIDLLPLSTASIFTADGKRWFRMPLASDLPEVWIFGAGHVGLAVVKQLSLLPCRLTWLDHREDWLAASTELVITRVQSESLADEIDSAPDNSHFVVMTHSHAIDFEICHAVLRRGRFAWLGLIGSDTKRHTFNKRLMQRGIDENLIRQLRCPIGNLGLQSSHPNIIALNLASELAALWQRDVQLSGGL